MQRRKAEGETDKSDEAGGYPTFRSKISDFIIFPAIDFQSNVDFELAEDLI